ncbi:hypothetical protein P4474_12455, partial [Geobacillus stearothermophilus]|nr:hypothetical protein [Geobacillus stearothermophilus]
MSHRSSRTAFAFSKSPSSEYNIPVLIWAFDPSEAYQGASFQEALRALEYVKRTRGIGLLIGEPGAGKT